MFTEPLSSVRRIKMMWPRSGAWGLNLKFSRIGRQSLSQEPVDMTTLARKAISDALAGRKAPLPVIEALDLPNIDGDRTLLQLVWLNLIDNAVKYTTGIDAAHIRIEAVRKEEAEHTPDVRQEHPAIHAAPILGCGWGPV